MVNAEQVLRDLQERARSAAESVDIDAKVEDAKDLARKVKERLETDETARNAAIGGGVLLAALLATRGGRRLTGTVAKTGLIAGLGALAYKAWQDRQGASQSAPDAHMTVDKAGFVSDDAADPDFSAAVVNAMAAAAYADGVIDPSEMEAIDGAAKEAGGDAAALVDGSMTQEETLDFVARAARSPNHAAQIYAAAVLATGRQAPEESAFLAKLADRLGVSAAHADAIRAEAKL